MHKNTEDERDESVTSSLQKCPKVWKLNIVGDECTGVRMCCSVTARNYGSEEAKKGGSAGARGRSSPGVQDHRVCEVHEHRVVCSRESENMEASNRRSVEVDERESPGATVKRAQMRRSIQSPDALDEKSWKGGSAKARVDMLALGLSRTRVVYVDARDDTVQRARECLKAIALKCTIV